MDYSLYNSVPLIVKNLTTGEFHFNSAFYWCIPLNRESKFNLISLGVDFCEGKSTLLNQLFLTPFHLNDGLHKHLKGTIDTHIDFFIDNPDGKRGFTVTDVHGTAFS